MLALLFLTRIPLPGLTVAPTPQQHADSVSFYPLVGAIIGLSLCLPTLLPLPYELTALCILLLWVAITGGLHLDGLGDSADGWMAAKSSPSDTLKIMHDPRCGSGAIIAISTLLLCKYSVLSHLARTESLQLIWLVPIIARSFVILLLHTTRYISTTDGIASDWIDLLATKQNYLILTIVTLLFTIYAPSEALIALPFTIITFLLWRYLLLRMLGGTNGDTAGALIEIIEVAVLISLCLT